VTDKVKPQFEMPTESVAVFDAVIAFFLLLVPGAVVGLIHQGYEEPLDEIQVGVIGLLFGFLAVFVYALIRRHALSLALRPAWALGRYGLFVLVWFPFAFWVYPQLMRGLDIPMPAQQLLVYVASSPNDGFLWLAIAVACIAAPLGEELFFRGFLFRAIEIHSHRYVALAVTTVLFALIHESSVMLPVFFLGLFFGYLRMKTGGVGSSILIHMLHNSWTIMVAVLAPETLDMVFDK
jgi:membrane protease YdiL (CAAX protease family)